MLCVLVNYPLKRLWKNISFVRQKQTKKLYTHAFYWAAFWAKLPNSRRLKAFLSALFSFIRTYLGIWYTVYRYRYIDIPYIPYSSSKFHQIPWSDVYQKIWSTSNCLVSQKSRHILWNIEAKIKPPRTHVWSGQLWPIILGNPGLQGFWNLEMFENDMYIKRSYVTCSKLYL